MTLIRFCTSKIKGKIVRVLIEGYIPKKRFVKKEVWINLNDLKNLGILK
jgi:hypothetical protein